MDFHPAQTLSTSVDSIDFTPFDLSKFCSHTQKNYFDDTDYKYNTNQLDHAHPTDTFEISYSLFDEKSSILQNMYYQENCFQGNFNKDYINNQTEINYKMRRMLIDYLIEVTSNWGYQSKTLFCSVGLLDFYLSKSNTTKDKLQLVGIVCLLIAAKFHEPKPYGITAYSYVTDGACTSQDIIEYEKVILSCIDYQINYYTYNDFCEALTFFSDLSDDELDYMRSLEYACINKYKLLQFKPSIIAKSLIYLTRKKFKKITLQEADTDMIQCIEFLVKNL